MPRKKKELRVPVSEDHIERFLSIVMNMVEPFGIDQNPEVMHHVGLLERSVERYVFEKKHSISPKKKQANDRKRFVAMFKGSYLQLTDLEYNQKITPTDAIVISQVIKTIQEHGLGVEDFIKWTFEEFLPDNPKFVPPTLKQICSGFFVQKFLYESQNLSKRRKEEDFEDSEATDLANRARALLRSDISEEDKDSLKKVSIDYRNRDIIIGELRVFIVKLERKLKQKNE